jgi:uncharacterized protein (DUF2062 family)
MVTKIKRAVRYRYLQLLRIRDCPGRVSRGFATGIAVGAWPCMGFQTIVGLPVVLLLRGNPFAMAIGVWWTNPLTAIPVYYFEYKIGVLIMSVEPMSYDRFVAAISGVSDLQSFLQLGYELLMPLVWGGGLFSVVLYPIIYFLTYKGLHARLLRKKKKRALKTDVSS